MLWHVILLSRTVPGNRFRSLRLMSQGLQLLLAAVLQPVNKFVKLGRLSFMCMRIMPTTNKLDSCTEMCHNLNRRCAESPNTLTLCHELRCLLCIKVWTASLPGSEWRSQAREDFIAEIFLCFFQVAEKAAWIEQQSRHRVAEVLGLMKKMRQEMNEVQLGEEEDEEV